MSKTLRQLLGEFSEREMDCIVTSLKVTIKTPSGGSLKTDYSARREAALEAIRAARKDTR